MARPKLQQEPPSASRNQESSVPNKKSDPLVGMTDNVMRIRRENDIRRLAFWSPPNRLVAS